MLEQDTLWITAAVGGFAFLCTLMVGSAALWWISRLRRLRLLDLLERVLPGVPEGLGRGADGAVVAAEAATTLDVLHHLSDLDPAVLDALEGAGDPSAAQSFQELVERLPELQADAVGDVGAVALAEQLRNAGHMVELVPAADGVGMSALVDGQPVVLEPGVGAEAIDAHLAVSDVPVITVAEHAEQYADVDGVFVTDVSGEQLEVVTQDTLEAVAGLEMVGSKIPVVTLAVSGARNLWRLWRGHTTVAKAAAFTAADTAGVGALGFAGAQMGVTLGVVAGPIGMGVGGLVGSLAGALAGRRMANYAKATGLRMAEAHLDRELEAYPASYVEALGAKVATLEQRAVALRRPRGRFGWWPTLGGLVREGMARRADAEAARLSEWVDRLSVELEEQPPAALAKDWLALPERPAAFTAELAEVTKRLSVANARVVGEQRALGRG